MLASLLSAGTSIIGGILGNKSQEKANKANAALQREFAQNSIQWKTEDAKKAGIHPIYALGAPTYSASPSYVGSTALSEGIAQAGQGISRAIDTGRTGGERTNKTLEMLTVQRAELENTKLASEIALMNQPGTPPAPQVPGTVIDGQGNGVSIKKHELTSTIPGAPSTTAGATPETTLYRTKNGYAPGMSEIYAEGEGESLPGMITHAIRNKLVPFLGTSQYHKGLPDPGPGYDWTWNPIGFEYVRTPKLNSHLKRKN